jgi:hypothetical protein
MKGVILLFTREARKKFGGLSQNRVLESILFHLEREYGIFGGSTRIKLPNPVSVEVANDSDGHRSRVGTMSYNEVSLLKFDQRLWAISIGVKSGAYPGENTYASDIVAIPLAFDNYNSDDGLIKEFSDQIGEYFRNSLLIGTVSGYIATADNSIFTHSVPRLISNIDDLFEGKAQQNTKCVNLDGTPIYDSFTTYKPSAIKTFADSIAVVLVNY